MKGLFPKCEYCEKDARRVIDLPDIALIRVCDDHIELAEREIELMQEKKDSNEKQTISSGSPRLAHRAIGKV